jgi:hypothetical protein
MPYRVSPRCTVCVRAPSETPELGRDAGGGELRSITTARGATPHAVVSTANSNESARMGRFIA